jgi:outer membrane receptor protein involved in Fe transport
MRQWVVVPALLTFLVAPPGAEAKQKIASSRELLQAGFFQDFEELDLEALLGANDAKVSVAARKRDSIDEAPGSVTVVTAEDLRAMGAHTLEDALHALPAVEVLRDGLGRPRIVIRGLSSGRTGGGSENVRVLLNGRSLDDPLFGGATVVNLAMPVANVSRIELLRGSASALYGSGAVAGVIDILTFRPEEYQGIEATVEAGSFDTQRYALRLGSEAGDLKTFGFLQFEDTNGARRRIERDSMSGRSATAAPGPTFDDFRQIETNYLATWRDWEAGIRISNVRSHGYVGLVDALGDNDLSYRQTQLSLAWKRELDELGTLRITGAWTQNRLKQFLQPLPPGFRLPLDDGGEATFSDGALVREDMTSRHYGVEGTLDRVANDHHFVGGLSLGREAVPEPSYAANYDFATRDPITSPQPSSLGGGRGRTLFSVFAQDSFDASDRVTLTGAIRFDNYSDVGGTLSPRAAAVFTLPSDVHLKLAYGRAFRAPSFAELYFDLPPFRANPDLDFVRADSVEAAVSYRRKAFRVVVTGYSSWFRDAIAPTGTFDPRRSRDLANSPGSDLRGLEFEVRRTIGTGHSLFVNYAFQHAEVEASGRALSGIPEHLGNLGATLALGGHVRATPIWSFRSSRPRAPGDARADTPGYNLFGLTVRALSLYRSLSLSLAGQNLFDKKYADPSVAMGVPGDYPRAGRRVLVGATYEF